MAEPDHQIAVVMPVHGQFEYVRAAIDSFTRKPDGQPLTLIVVDDGSRETPVGLFAACDGEHREIIFKRFNSALGLTHALNWGIGQALELGCRHIAAVNSDVLVPPGWWRPLVAASQKQNLNFSGPLTNAPGVSNPDQDVRAWYEDYILTDLASGIEGTAQILQGRYAGRNELGDINGFFMFGDAASWQAVRHDDAHVFPPSIPVMPSGRPNPFPLMAGQECWLSQRCREKGLAMGIALDSFCFHYRSVSRGQRHVTPGWSRRDRPPAR